VRTLDINNSFNYNTLRLQSLETGKEREVSLNFTASTLESIKWSSDNKHIFLRGQDKKKRGGLFKLNVQTGISELILDFSTHEKSDPNLEIYTQDWSADGSDVYETVMNWRAKRSQRKTDIVRTDLETGTKKTIYQNKQPFPLTKIRLSPDEEWIAFVKESISPARQTISIIPSQGGKEIELFQNSEKDLNLGSLFWDSSGKGLIFTKRYFTEDGEEARKNELWYIPSFNGTSPRKLELEMFGIQRLNFHPDGQTIAFDSRKYADIEFWVMENFLSVLNDTKK